MIDCQTMLEPVSENSYIMASNFPEIFELILDMYAPIKRRGVRDECAPWLNQSIRECERGTLQKGLP